MHGIERFGGASEIGDVLPMFLEIFERLRGIVERRLGELRKRVVQILWELRIEPVAHSGVAHDAEQVQVLLDVRAAEETLAKLCPILGPLIVSKNRIGIDKRLQRVSACRHAIFHQV